MIEQISSEPVRVLKVEDLPLISKNMKNIVRRAILLERHWLLKVEILFIVSFVE